MSSRTPTSVGFTLERLARRGGRDGPHRDGWGVAVYEARDALLLREPCPAAESELVHFIERHIPAGRLFISHIRLATQGERALRNTQPFQRELGGNVHVFAHNGDMMGIERRTDFVSQRFRPVGDTDSEQVFCSLLERLGGLWDRADGIPPLGARLDAVASFAAELRRFGPANFIYADGDALFVHAHRRTQSDGRIAPPGLHILERRCDDASDELSASGVTLKAGCEEMTLVASVPLTDGPWQPMGEGEVAVIINGRLVERCPC